MVVLLIVSVLAAPAVADAYRAEIRRTAYGIPHITGETLGDAGFGYGHALAQDNICTIAQDHVTVRAERSRFFGPEASYVFEGNAQRVNNLNSDFFFQRIIDRGDVEALLGQPPPQGPRPEVVQVVRGYVAGYNEYLRSVGGADGLDDPRCKGAPWVREITEIDAWRRIYQLVLLASQGVAINGIAEAAPPHGEVVPAPSAGDVVSGLYEAGLANEAVGSNAVALGREATGNGRGMLLANPHFPWQGSERLYQAHVSVPGKKLDVQGASLYGVPLMVVGHTANMAWSHTMSRAFRFTPFEVALVPGSPTTYLYDGQRRRMRADRVTVDPGNGHALTRTLYSTHHGPVFTSLVGLPFPWTPAKAFVMGDANAANFRVMNHFFEANMAQSVDDLDAALKRNLGVPWVNTIAADSTGRAYYADISVVPNVPDAKARGCGTSLGQATFQALRLPVLDGSRSACEWGTDPDAPVPGIFGPGNLPSLARDDYAMNSNDSYWLSNSEQPLEGFNRIIGDERTARTLRTRSGLVMLEEQLADGGMISLSELRALTFANRVHAGELLRDGLVEMCRESPVAISSSGPVDVGEACRVLAAWDLRDDLDSNGAILFRRFATRAVGVTGGPFRVPFSASDPVHTPRGLNTAHPQVRQALGDAVNDLETAGIPLDAPLRGYQYELRGDEPIPIHGGPHATGVFNVINAPWQPPRGFPDVPYGSSFVMTTQFAEGDCPVETRSIMTYSQSSNPESPHSADQTRLYSEKQWLAAPFCRADVLAAAPVAQVVSDVP